MKMTTPCSEEDQPQTKGGPIIPFFPLKPVTKVQGATRCLRYLKQMCYQEWINTRCEVVIQIKPAHTTNAALSSISAVILLSSVRRDFQCLMLPILLDRFHIINYYLLRHYFWCEREDNPPPHLSWPHLPSCCPPSNLLWAELAGYAGKLPLNCWF